jgi:3-hydroxyisobutyrate dehydrogenase-like beta-hydroxyacid dehydrogenase
MRELAVIGLLHPGEMGSAVGRSLLDAGHEVIWASQGRSEDTASRASAAALRDVGTTAVMAGQAGVIVSVCPPHAAVDVASSVVGFAGLYVDANAISPQTARRVCEIVEAGGASYADGGLIGPPPATAGTTRLYLSGPNADAARKLFDGTALDARIAAGPGEPWAASALKMAYAAWTKGSAALLLDTWALAEALGVSEVLNAEWQMSQPALPDRLRGARRSAAAKGWRWVAEMQEVAATMTSAGLPDGFHQAASEVYRLTSGPMADSGPAG